MTNIPQWTAPEVARVRLAQAVTGTDQAAEIEKQCQKISRAARNHPFGVVCTFGFAEALRAEGLIR